MRFIRSTLWAVWVCTNQSHVFFVGCLSLGPRKNDLTNYWALGPFVRSFTPLVDPGDIYPPQVRLGVFIWAVRSQGGRTDADAFCRVHDLNYQTKARAPDVASQKFKS